MDDDGTKFGPKTLNIYTDGVKVNVVYALPENVTCNVL